MFKIALCLYLLFNSLDWDFLKIKQGIQPGYSLSCVDSNLCENSPNSEYKQLLKMAEHYNSPILFDQHSYLYSNFKSADNILDYISLFNRLPVFSANYKQIGDLINYAVTWDFFKYGEYVLSHTITDPHEFQPNNVLRNFKNETKQLGHEAYTLYNMINSSLFVVEDINLFILNIKNKCYLNIN